MRHLAVRAELLGEHLGVDAELLDGLGLQLLDARHLLGPGHLVAVGGVGEVAQLVLHRDQLGAQGHGGLLALEAVGLGGVAQGGGAGQGGGHPLDGVGRGGVHGRGDGGLPTAALPALAQPLARGQLVAGRALERVGPALQGAGPLLAGAQGEPQLGLGGAGAARGELEPVALVGGRVVGLLGGRGLGPGEAGLELVELGAVALEGEPRLGDGALGAVGLGRRGAHGGTEATEPLGDGRHPGVGLVQRLERRLDLGADLAGAVAGRAQGEPGALGAGGRGIQVVRVSSTAACSSSRLSPALLPPRAQPGPKTSPSAVTAVMPSARATSATAWAAVGHQRDPLEQLLDGGAHRLGGAHDVARPDGRAVELGPGGRVARGCRAADEQRGAPAVAVTQRCDGARGVRGARDRERLAGPAQGGGDRRLVATETWSREATVPTTAWSASAAASRVAAPSLRRRLSSSASILAPAEGTVALGVALAGDQHLDLGLDLGEARGGGLVGVVEALLALLLDGDAALEAGELLLGLGGTGAGGGNELLETADLGLPGLDPAARVAGPRWRAWPAPRGGRRRRGRCVRAGPARRHTPPRPPRGRRRRRRAPRWWRRPR